MQPPGPTDRRTSRSFLVMLITAMGLLLVPGCGGDGDDGDGGQGLSGDPDGSDDDPPILSPVRHAPDVMPIDVEWIWPDESDRVVTIRIAVQNIGALPAGSFSARIDVVMSPCDDGYERVRGTYTVTFEDGLAAGEAGYREVQHDFERLSGLFGIYLAVDDQDAVEEYVPEGDYMGAYDGEINNAYRCNDVRMPNGGVVLARDETYIVVEALEDDDDDDWWWGWENAMIND